MSVPYTFASATTSIPLSQLDSNFSYFADAITVSSGNVGIGASIPAAKLDISGNTGLAIQASLTSGADANFHLYAVNGSSSNATGQEVARFGVGYNGNASTQFSAGFSFIRGSSSADGSLAILTNANERMRIDSSGSVLVGTNATGSWNNNCWGVQTNNGFTVTGHVTGTVSGTAYAYFDYNNSPIGSITQNGTTGVAYNTSSDYRLKENVQNMTGALDRVAQLKPVTYQWKSDGSNGEGFIAHELAEVCPLAVSGEKDAVDEDGNIIPQGIDPSKIVSLLTAAIQELKAELDAVKSELNALKNA